MPAVTPALDAIAPSTTKTRLSTTCACGARPRNWSSNSWCVVQRCVASSPARAASNVPEQMVTSRCGVPSASSSGRMCRLSQAAVARLARLLAPSWALGWPTSTSQVGALSSVGNGSMPASPRPTELSASVCGPV
jgi:hypothetical protein